MKCYDCGGSMVEHRGNLELPSKMLGSFELINVTFYKCDQCGEIIIPEPTWLLADQQEEELVKGILRNLPLKEFVSTATAAEMLGMTRQALHKHRRIKKGFVYSINHEGKVFYHRESLSLFKETGDGRLRLKPLPAPKTTYIYCVGTPPQNQPGPEHEYRELEGQSQGLRWDPRQIAHPTPMRYCNA